MKLSQQQTLVLYALGEMCQCINTRFSQEALEACITKAAFIRLVQSIKLFSKKERALYKNLEMLEAKKIITYAEKKVLLSKIGQKKFAQLTHQITPFLQMRDVIKKEDLLKYTKVQTFFNSKVH